MKMPLSAGFLDRGKTQAQSARYIGFVKGRVLLDRAQLVEVTPEDRLTAYLGIHKGRAVHAVDMPEGTKGRPTDLWLMPPEVSGEDLALAAQGQHLLRWHAKNRFCAQTGALTEPSDQGRKRICLDTGAEIYPRIDPAVIMLVQSPDLQRIILAHTHAMPPGLHSLLAGYVEPGETLEDTVRRETFEEAGLMVDQVQYVASQPWALSGSIMIGFTCVAKDETLNIDPEELESAAWYSRADIAKPI